MISTLTDHRCVLIEATANARKWANIMKIFVVILELWPSHKKIRMKLRESGQDAQRALCFCVCELAKETSTSPRIMSALQNLNLS